MGSQRISTGTFIWFLAITVGPLQVFWLTVLQKLWHGDAFVESIAQIWVDYNWSRVIRVVVFRRRLVMQKSLCTITESVTKRYGLTTDNIHISTLPAIDPPSLLSRRLYEQ